MDESLSGQASVTSRPVQAQSSDPREGLITTWVEGSLGVMDEIVRAGFGFFEDARTETQERLGATLDLLEGINQSMFRVARKTLVRMDGISARALASSEQGWYALLGMVRRTSQGAAGLASETAVSLVGDRRQAQQLIMKAS
ncbi:hypothetical protein SOCEGT47_017890 [Sorangium cellulosum]|uniref:Phasin domain-containing protein n=1 Tax=Sorangium cellulosum TaxID=56 RepID=A0A4P2PXN9_SORCE|nr:hypothetical protein [Sorangium cellulosum]AUX21308.1 hypothetical protein SOCEGT47_017890 [Sorangium cellulosum]